MTLLERIRVIPGGVPVSRWVASPLVSIGLLVRGLVNRRYYSTQVGRTFLTAFGAGVHFANRGFYLGYAPSRRFEPTWASEMSGRSLYEVILAVALRGPGSIVRTSRSRITAAPGATPVSPLAEIDPAVILEDATTTARRRAVTHATHDVRAVEAREFEATDAAPPVSAAYSGIDWDELRARDAQRDPALVSILMPTFEDWILTSRAVGAVLANSRDAAIEIIVVDNGSKPHVSRILRGLFVNEPRVIIVTKAINLNFSGGTNAAFARSTGARVVLLNNDTEVQEGWLQPLLDALEVESTLAVQPLLLYPSGVIQAAGSVYGEPTVLPHHFLAGHPIEDLERLDEGALDGFATLTAACMAMRASDYSAISGFDEGFINGTEDVDLCLRLREHRDGSFQVEPRSRVTHLESESISRIDGRYGNRYRLWRRWAGAFPENDLWRYAGLGVEHVHFAPLDTTDEQTGMIWGASHFLVRLPVPSDAGRHGKRVAIRLPLGVSGERATGLASAARELADGLAADGIHAIVDSPTARYRTSRYLDAAVIHFSIDAAVNLQPGVANVGVQVGGVAFTESVQRSLSAIVAVDEGDLTGVGERVRDLLDG